MAREIRIELSDEAYAQLQRAAALKRVPAEAYAGQVLDSDLVQARFREGARMFLDEHAAGFAAAFGTPAPRASDADAA